MLLLSMMAAVLVFSGGSGMGKSMTLKMIAGLVKPDSGKVIVDGRIVYDSAAKIDMPARERHIGYLFQQYALFPTMTVTENIGIAMKKSGERRRKKLTDFWNSLPFRILATVCRMNYPADSSSE